MTISQFLEIKYGYNPNLREPWDVMISLWNSWYQGYNNPNSRYTIWNGRSRIPMHKKSMQMAKKVCEDWADVLYNVNCPITLQDPSSNAELQEVLAYNSWWLVVNQAIEKAFALGTVALMLNAVDLGGGEKGKIRVEVVGVDKIYPISWVNGRCTECAFVAYQKLKGKTYAVISVHLKENGTYHIENYAFEVSRSNHIQDISENVATDLFGAFDSFDTGSSKPWFALISPAIAENNFKQEETTYDYPLGISVFANSIDALCAVDDCFDALDNEINLGRKRLFVKGPMCSTVDGQPVFDATDVSVYQLPEGFNAEDLIQPENSELRVEEIVAALNTNMSIISNAVGLGKAKYQFDTEKMMTAAQVYSSDSETRRKMDKHRTRIENELFDLVSALIEAANRYGGYNIRLDGLSIGFDTTQFESEDTKAARKLKEKESGIISAAEYRESMFGEDKGTAEQRIDMINQERKKELEFMMVQEEVTTNAP